MQRVRQQNRVKQMPWMGRRRSARSAVDVLTNDLLPVYCQERTLSEIELFAMLWTVLHLWMRACVWMACARRVLERRDCATADDDGGGLAGNQMWRRI